MPGCAFQSCRRKQSGFLFRLRSLLLTFVSIRGFVDHQFKKRRIMEIILREESYAVIGACCELYKVVGSGFTEPIYQECLEKEGPSGFVVGLGSYW